MAKRRPKKGPEPKAIGVDVDGLKSKLKPVGGGDCDAWNSMVANQVAQAQWLAHSTDEEQTARMHAAVQGMVGIGPKDEIEGMMGAQLLAAHAAAMECFRRAMIENQSFEGRREALNQANKLTRSFATLVEALNRHRGKGTQVVRVERVTVEAGGQALVGAVTHPGGGPAAKMEDQPHEHETESIPDQPALSQEPPMRCPNPSGHPLPSPRHEGPDPLPAPRRQSQRRAKGE